MFEAVDFFVMLVLLDGYSIFFRAYYAMPEMKGSAGKNVNAVYGFLRQVLNILKYDTPSHFLIALDTGGGSFRNAMQEEFILKRELAKLIEVGQGALLQKLTQEDLNEILNLKMSVQDLIKKLNVLNLPSHLQSDLFVVLATFLGFEMKEVDDSIGYKANRKELPQDFIDQFDILDEMINAIGVPMLRVQNYEADDIIANFALKNEGKTTIFSSDKDIMQLVSEKVSFFDVASKKYFQSKEVEEKFGVKPHQIPDYLALLGDSSDNIPGVPSVGKVTASKLINQFGNVEDMFEKISQYPSQKIRDSILSHKEQILFAKKMTTLKIRDGIGNDFEYAKFNGLNSIGLKDFSVKHGFKSIGFNHISKNNATEKLDEKDAKGLLF